MLTLHYKKVFRPVQSSLFVLFKIYCKETELFLNCCFTTHHRRLWQGGFNECISKRVCETRVQGLGGSECAQ